MADLRACSVCGAAFQAGTGGAATAVSCPSCSTAGRGQTVAFSPGEAPVPALPPAPTATPTLTIPLPPGTVFRGLRVEALLGKGGMGVVHRARQISLERDVALKLLWPRYAPTAELLPRFEREARLLASLNHPNIVHVYDFGSEGGLFFLTLEFVDGRTLAAHLADGKGADLPWILKMMVDVTKGLEKIHRAGLVHRDLKPANIFVSRGGTAKIGDFGLAIEAADSLKLTQSGVFVGSPHYASPEHVQGNPVDGRTDLYALGVILFEAIAGDPPFVGTTATSVLLKHVQETAPALEKVAPQTPPLVAAIVKKLLAKKADDRYSTAAAVRADLVRAFEQIRKGAVPKATPPALEARKPEAAATRATLEARKRELAGTWPAPRPAATAPRKPEPAPPAQAQAARQIPWPWVAAGAAASLAVVLLVLLLARPSDPAPAEPPPEARRTSARPEPPRSASLPPVKEETKPDASATAGLEAAKKTAPAPEDAEALAESMLALAESAWAAEDFERVAALAKEAEPLARTAKATALADRLRERGGDALEARKDRDLARKVMRPGPTGGGEPSECLAWGRYLAFWRGRWEEGLPLLERAGDWALKSLVVKDRSAAATPSAWLDLAQAWGDAAQKKEKGSAERRRYLVRAADWADRAAPGATGILRVRIQKCLEDIEAELPSRGLNLLARIDVAKDSFEGAWTMESGALVSPEAGIPRVQIPVQPPAEYDLLLTVARRSGPSSFNVGLVSSGRRFVLSLDGFQSYDIAGIDQLDGRPAEVNETRVKEKQFADERPRLVVCSVRRGGVSMTVDGRRLVDWKGDPKRLTLSPAFTVPDERVPFLLTGRTSYSVTRLVLLPVSGPAQKLR